MKISRYLASNIVNAILLVLLVFLSLFIFIGLTKEFSDIGTCNYGFLNAFLYVLMQLPSTVYQFFPVFGLLGSLIALGMLASRHELIVMQASGVSTFKITRIVLQAAFVIIILSFVVGEVLAPKLQLASMSYKSKLMKSHERTFRTAHGLWLRQGDEFVRIDTILPHKKIKNITFYKFDKNNNLVSSTYAESGIFRNNAWVFKDITESKFLKNRIQIIHIKQKNLGVKIKPQLLKEVKVGSSEKTLLQLHSYIKYLKYNGLSTNKYSFLYWHRIFRPLATLAMILLSIPFIFGPLRSVSMGLRILTGASIGLAFFLSRQT